MADLLALPDELVVVLLGQCAPKDIASAASTCRTLARVASTSALAEILCRRRWAVPNARAFCTCGAGQHGDNQPVSEGGRATIDPENTLKPSAYRHTVGGCSADALAALPLEPHCGDVDWRRLYTESNGWRQPNFKTEALQPRAEFITSIAFSHSPSFAGHAGSPLLVASSSGVDVWACGKQGRPARVAQYHMHGVPDSETLYAVRQASEDTLIAGSSGGSLMVFREEGQPPALIGPGRDACSSVVDLQVMAQSGGAVVVSLHDTTFAMQQPAGQRNVLQMWDMQAEKPHVAMTDVMDGYELVAMCCPSGSANELVAGSIQRDFCFRCYSQGLPSLCHHKPHTHSAAICMFDVRAHGGGMVQRFNTQHRSLYPVMTSVREHFLLTSHAGTPLSVWDRRNMVAPIYEEPHLLHVYGGAHDGSNWHDPGACPFPVSRRGAEHQGLFLAANADCLVGRAENGMMWLWDLSVTLGWSSGASAAEAVGPWQTMWSWGDDGAHELARSSRPKPLGALSCGTCLPFVDICCVWDGAGQQLPTTQIACLSSELHGDDPADDSLADSEYVMCATLLGSRPVPAAT